MVNTSFNQQKRIPINRNNLFYSENDFIMETEIAENYLMEDTNQTVILYRVDLNKTNLDDIYNESKKDSIIFKPPVELHCLYEIEESSLMSYDKTKNLGTYVKSGKLTVNVMQKTLDDLDVEITVGDYIGVVTSNDHIEIYVVIDSGRNNFDNAKYTFGYKNTWRKVICSPVSDETEFKA